MTVPADAVALPLVLGGTSLFITEIKKAISGTVKFINRQTTTTLTIEQPKCPTLFHALTQEIHQLFANSRNQNVTDGVSLNFIPAQKSYHIIYLKYPLRIKLESVDKIIISSYTASVSKLKDYAKEVYAKYQQPNDRVQPYYMNNTDDWVPCVRRDRPNMRITDCMQEMLDDVEDFDAMKIIIISKAGLIGADIW